MQPPVMPSLSQITISHSVVVNVIFNTCFSSIICYIGKFYLKDIYLNCHFELFREICMKIITTGEIYSFELWIINVFEITRLICMNFSSLGREFKLKFKLTR
jgi:hypothetical protein